MHAGAVGAGHYAKMVHNGIEYGLMQAYAEGYELLAAKDIVTDVPACFKAWTRGTVVRSWLLDLLVKALEEDPDLAADPRLRRRLRRGPLDRRGGASTTPCRCRSSPPSLFARFASRQDDSPGDEGGRRAAQPVRRPRGRRRPRRRGRSVVRPARPGLTRDRARRAPVADRLPLATPEVELPLDAGRHRARRAERPGQDQPGRGGRLPRDAGQPPGVHRRAAGPARAPSAAIVRGRGRAATGAPTLVELEITPGKANRARLNRVAGAAAARGARHAAHGAVRAGGPGPGQGRPGRAAPVPRRPAGRARTRGCAGVRADYDRVLKQRNALLKSAGAGDPSAARADVRTLDVWDSHLAAAGRRAARRAARTWSPTLAPLRRARRTTQVSAGQGAGGDRLHVPRSARARGGRRTAPAPDRELLAAPAAGRAGAAARRPSSSAG